MKKDEVKKVSLWRQTLRDLRGLHKSFRLWVLAATAIFPLIIYAYVILIGGIDELASGSRPKVSEEDPLFFLVTLAASAPFFISSRFYIFATLCKRTI